MPKRTLQTDIEVTLPVYNEEQELNANTLKLYSYLKTGFYHKSFSITIADNASTDATPVIARSLTKKHQEIHYLRLNKKGRGRAIKTAWTNSNARILSYMDIDLSTDLKSFNIIINSLTEGSCDLAVGSRLLKDSQIYQRPLLREILSRGLNIIIKLLFQTKFTDAQCGFKAISSKSKNILPAIIDNEWFFDSELLIIADKVNLRIHEVPIVWVDNPGSTVRVLGTVIGDLKGLFRLFFTRPWNKIKI